MTTIARLYIAACGLPPSVERTTLLEGLSREDRIMRTGTYGKQAILEHYRHILGCIEHTRSMPIDGLMYEAGDPYYRPDWVAVERESHARALAFEHERAHRRYGEPKVGPVIIKRARRYRDDVEWTQ